MDVVTWSCLVAGIVTLLFALGIAARKGDWSTSWLPFAAAIVLMTLSRWKSIELSPDSLKLLRDTAAASDSLAAQTQKTASAVQTTQNQVKDLTTLLANRNVLQPQDVLPIQQRLNSAPRADTATIRRSRETFRSIQAPSALDLRARR